jgi:hypothetical protein
VDEPDVPILQERLAAIGTRIDREEKPFGGDV